MIEILIQNGDTIYMPCVEDGIQLEWDRKGLPGKLTFSVVKDDVIDFTEGNVISLKVDNAMVFSGFIFTKKRDKGNTIKVTAYDQMRYFKNKDTYVYSNKTASEVLKMIAEDFKLNVGEIEDTGFKIESRVEDNKTLFDILQTAIDLTLQNKKKMFVLYDDFGKLTLKNVENMKLDLLIDEESGQNFDYTSTLDGETYNKVKLVYNNDETGKRDVYIARNSGHMNDWGILQYFETTKENVNGKAKADALLSLYNQKTRNLTIREAFGDVRVRAGCAVIVKLNLGDITVGNYMMVEKVKHTFKENQHTMDLTLRGGGFIA